MDYQTTKNKTEAWCDALHAQGLITDKDLEQCKRAFTTMDAPILIQPRTDNTFSFGLTRDRRDIVNNRTMRAILRNDERVLTVKQDIVKLISNRELSNVFVIQVQSSGHYTIMNENTGKYLWAESPKVIRGDGVQLGSEAEFRLVQRGPRESLYTFESVAYSGRYLGQVDGDAELIPEGPGIYWDISILTPDTEPESPLQSEASTLINNLLDNIQRSRLDFYNIMAQIEFLEVLRGKVYNMVKNDGDIMNYYFDRKDARQLDVSEDVLKYIQFSINNEIRSREGSQIDDKIKQLTLKAKEIEGGEFLVATSKGNDLLNLLKDQIEAKKAALGELNALIEKVEAQQRDLNQKQDVLEKEEKELTHRDSVLDSNYTAFNARDTRYKREYYYMIALSILVVIILAFWGFKLYKRFRVVFDSD